MTPELTYLAWSALLTAVIWMPYIVGQVVTNGFLSAGNYQDPTPRPVPNWVNRANRAHLNAVESFAPFAALVWIVHVTNGTNEVTALCAAIFFWCRLGHAIVYWLGIPFVRTLLFAAANFATIGLFYEAIT